MGEGRIPFIFLAAFFLLSGCLTTKPSSTASPSCSHDPNAFRCVRFLGNYDGDTISVSIPDTHPLLGEKISVRIAGIDTAEMKGKGRCEKEAARRAKQLVENKLAGSKRIDLENVARDKYFRILADVRVDGSSLKDLLLEQHLALPYDGGKKTATNWCPQQLATPKQ